MSDYYCPECGVIPAQKVTAVRWSDSPTTYFCPQGHKAVRIDVKCPECGTKMKRALGSLTCPKCRLRFSLEDIA